MSRNVYYIVYRTTLSYSVHLLDILTCLHYQYSSKIRKPASPVSPRSRRCRALSLSDTTSITFSMLSSTLMYSRALFLFYCNLFLSGNTKSSFKVFKIIFIKINVSVLLMLYYLYTSE